MKRTRSKIIVIIMLIIASSACRQTYTPKPEAYFRIDFPEKNYQRFDSAHYPYNFDYPDYAVIEEDKGDHGNAYWANMNVPRFGATIHLTYYPLTGNLSDHTELTREFAFKHTSKAEAIEQKEFFNPERNTYGILYNIEGNTASNVQFYMTDSTNHYLRGALYFMCRPNKDSLAPVIDFFRQDIIRLMESLAWEESP